MDSVLDFQIMFGTKSDSKKKVSSCHMMVYVQQTWKFQGYTFQLQLKRENETEKINKPGLKSTRRRIIQLWSFDLGRSSVS